MIEPETMPTRFEPIATFEEIIARLRQDHAPDSRCNVGERAAASVCSFSMDEARQFADRLDTMPEDEAADCIDLLAHAEESLRARLDIVRSALLRVAIIAKERGH